MSTALLLALIALAVSVFAFLRLYLGREPYQFDGPVWAAFWMVALLPVMWVIVTVFCIRDAFKRRSGKQILAALLVSAPTAGLFAATINDRFWSHRQPPLPMVVWKPRESPTSEQMHKMVTMMLESRQDQFQQAIDTGTAALKNDPSDTYLLEEIAGVYARRAQKDAEHREKWVSEEVVYLNRTISIDPENKFPDKFYVVGDGFEQAGDLSTSKRCFYYRRSLDNIQNQAQLLADHKFPDDEEFRRYEIKYQDDAVLTRVKTKMAKANCK
jgi:hypothetical protein